MGIFSFFARKAVAVFPTYKYVKAPSSSSGFSSGSEDSTDSDHVLIAPPTVQTLDTTSPTQSQSSPSRTTGLCNGTNQVDDPTTNDYLFAVSPIKSTKNRTIRFSSQLEQVYLIENLCNDPDLDLWSNRMDYTRRYKTDLAAVRSHMPSHSTPSPSKSHHISKKRLWIREYEYLTTCSAAYHQFCLTGTVDKSLQRILLIGVECGYRALERLSSDQSLRRELANRIRTSTVQFYRTLIQHRIDSLQYDIPDHTDMYLRAHIENLNFHHIRWSLFMGRLDRLAARSISNTNDDKAMIVAYRLFTKQCKIHSTPPINIRCGSTSSKVSMDAPSNFDNRTVPSSDDDQFGMEGFSPLLC